MKIHKTLKINTKSLLSTQRAGPDNIQIDDIIKYKSKQGYRYALVIDIRNIALKVRDIIFKDDKYFLLDDNHNEQTSPHKGYLNYDYTQSDRVRNIHIVDRNQFIDNEDIKLDMIVLKLQKVERLIFKLKDEIKNLK